jgi:glycosyltransferase involved in cell wall biosynthesis
MKISAVIIAGNEEAKIADAVRSVAWADEVLVVDSESTDRTREIAEGLGAHVIVNAWPGFSAQKQFGVDNASNDWVFSLDADERVSSALRESIERIRATRSASLPAAYRIPRLTYYLGQPVRHGGWYPDRQTRLFDRRHGKWNGRIIHESWSVNDGSEIADLDGNIIHYTVDTLDEHERMIRTRYAPLGAKHMFESGRRSSHLALLAAGPAAFIQTYLLKLGALDGAAGWHIARFAAMHARLKHEMLLEMQHTNDRR